MKQFKIFLIALPFLFLLFSSFVQANNIAGSWSSAKNRGDDIVYADHKITLYCGCTYKSHNNSSGGGKMTAQSCGIPEQPKNKNSAKRIEWEHIVPASHMPARQFSCWENPKQISECKNLKGRPCCEKVSSSARAMMFDLHNLAPSFGQINQYRLNGRYGVVEHPKTTWGANCSIKDMGETSKGSDLLFEPVDCTKGDVARVWLYMHQEHGVFISKADLKMFKAWSKKDPVSKWEKKRHDRIKVVQGNANPFVEGVQPKASGACEWE